MNEKERVLKFLVDRLVKRELTQIQKRIKGYCDTMEYHERIKCEFYHVWIEREDLFVKFLNEELIFRIKIIKRLNWTLKQDQSNWKELITQLIKELK